MGSVVARQYLPKQFCPDTAVLHVLRLATPNVLGDAAELAPRLGKRRVRLQLREDGEEVRAIIIAQRWGEGERNPELLVARRQRVRSRRDADHRVLLSVESDLLAEEGGITGVSRLPERITQDRHARRICLVRQKVPAEDGTRVAGLEEAWRDPRADDARRLAVSKAECLRLVRGDRRE